MFPPRAALLRQSGVSTAALLGQVGPVLMPLGVALRNGKSHDRVCHDALVLGAGPGMLIRVALAIFSHVLARAKSHHVSLQTADDGRDWRPKPQRSGERPPKNPKKKACPVLLIL